MNSILLIIRSLLDFFWNFSVSNRGENEEQKSTLDMPIREHPVWCKIRT